MHFQEKMLKYIENLQTQFVNFLSLTRVKVSDAVLNDLEKDYVKDEYFKENGQMLKNRILRKTNDCTLKIAFVFLKETFEIISCTIIMNPS